MNNTARRSLAVLAAGLLVLTGTGTAGVQTLGSSITAAAASATVKDESGFTLTVYDDAEHHYAEVSGVWEAAPDMVIPASVTYDGAEYPVTEVNKVQNTDIVSIVIPDSVKVIGCDSDLNENGGAFYQCYGLESITIPESVETIKNFAFKGCSALVSVTIPGSVKSIENYAFEDCGSLATVEFAEGSTENGGCVIGERAFLFCDSLKDVKMGAGITAIGEGAFLNCTALENLTLSPTLEEIADSAFNGCSALAEIDLPDSLISLYPNAFAGTAAVNDQSGTSAVTYVDDWALGAADSTVRLTLKDGTRGIARSAFQSIGSSLTLVTLPDTLEYINDGAFEGCYNVDTLTLPERLKVIGTEAFSGCQGLQTVTLPASVESVGANAFERCFGLQSISVLNPECKIDNSTNTALGDSSTVIKGYDDSTAFWYADNYGLTFESLGAAPDTPDTPAPSGDTTWNGINPDLNSDGVIDSTDASFVLLYAAELGSGEVTSYAQFMEKYFSASSQTEE